MILYFVDILTKRMQQYLSCHVTFCGHPLSYRMNDFLCLPSSSFLHKPNHFILKWILYISGYHLYLIIGNSETTLHLMLGQLLRQGLSETQKIVLGSVTTIETVADTCAMHSQFHPSAIGTIVFWPTAMVEILSQTWCTAVTTPCMSTRAAPALADRTLR